MMRSTLFGWAMLLILAAVCAGQEVELPETQPPNSLEAVEASSSQAPYARLVEIPLPLQGTVDTQVRRSIEQILATVPEGVERPIIVLEFTKSAGTTGDSSEFGRALDLSRFLISPKASKARLVAYLPETIKGHAVLVALACEEIVMHPDAQLGAAGIDEESIDATVRRSYTEVADRRLTIPSAVALGFLDPELQVQRLSTSSGDRYALDSDVPKIQQEVSVQKIDTIIPAGEFGLLSGDKLRLDFGFVSHLATDRQDLAAVLKVSPSDLELNPILGGDWRALRINLNGPMNSMLVEQALRGMEDRLSRSDLNFVCVAIDSPGGSIEDSLRLAAYLSALDSNEIRTVAYVPREARADAALVALACDQIAIHEDAVLGGGGARVLSPSDVESATQSIQAIMADKDRAWSVPVGIVDPNLEVVEYALDESPQVKAYFCEEELQQQRNPDRWDALGPVSTEGDGLQFDGVKAADQGLAQQVVSDYEEFLQRYQIEERPEELKPNWAQELVVALANPRLAAGLLFIGFFAIIIEANAPGLGIGGFVAAVCFLLFFWSNFLQGTAGWLEVLLFFAGLLFISLEVFVIPGFGIFGLGGGVMVVLSLVLASQTFVIPQNAYQFGQLPRSLLIVAGAMAGVGIGAVLLHRYLGESPLVKRFMLEPAEGEFAKELERRESVVLYDHLVGKQGRTTTRLSPAGKADIDGDLYDVVSDGLVVAKRMAIEVVEVVGNKIVVREA